MIIKSTILAMLLAFCFANSADAKKNKFITATVDETFIPFGFEWVGGNGGYKGLIGTLNIDGALYFCGIGANSGAYSISVQPVVVLRGYVLYQDSRKILTGMHFFTEAKRGSNLIGQKVKCKLTRGEYRDGNMGLNIKYNGEY